MQALKEGDSSNGQRCAEALLVSLTSSDEDAPNWVYGVFLVYGVKYVHKIFQVFTYVTLILTASFEYFHSCDSELPWTTQNQKKGEPA